MVPIKRTVFFSTVTVLKNMVRLIKHTEMSPSTQTNFIKRNICETFGK